MLLQTLTDSIKAGEFDDLLHYISDAITERRQVIELILTAAKEAAAKPQLIQDEKVAGVDYGVDDYVCLNARNGDVHAMRFLQKWGRWWKVQAAINRGVANSEKWLLKSIANQPREISKTKVETIGVKKEFDELYAVIGVLKFPAEFNYKVAELNRRTQQS